MLGLARRQTHAADAGYRDERRELELHGDEASPLLLSARPGHMR